MIQHSAGALLQQIIREAISNTKDSSSPKVIVRIGTPVSVAALLSACVAPPPRLPDPGAALLFELHEKLPSKQGNKEQNALSHGQRFGFKVRNLLILFENYKSILKKKHESKRKFS